MLYTVAGWRVPLAMVNVSRALSAPITLEPDHNDILAARDSEEFNRIFGRSYNTTEGYMTHDAEYMLIMSNSFSTLGKAAVEKARKKGIKAGLLRLRLIRPFPDADLKAILTGKKLRGSSGLTTLSEGFREKDGNCQCRRMGNRSRSLCKTDKLAADTGIWALKEAVYGDVRHTVVPKSNLSKTI